MQSILSHYLYPHEFPFNFQQSIYVSFSCLNNSKNELPNSPHLFSMFDEHITGKNYNFMNTESVSCSLIANVMLSGSINSIQAMHTFLWIPFLTDAFFCRSIRLEGYGLLKWFIMKQTDLQI